MTRDGIEELFPQARDRDPVPVPDQPYKLGWLDDDIQVDIQVNRPENQLGNTPRRKLDGRE